MSGQTRFDGFDVTVFEGNFAGTFDLDATFAEDLRFDDVVTFVVTGRIGGVKIGDTKLGDMKRTNTFQVTSSVALDPQTATKVLNSMGQMVSGVNAGQMSLGQEPPTDTLDDDYDAQVESPGIPVKDKALADFLSE